MAQQPTPNNTYPVLTTPKQQINESTALKLKDLDDEQTTSTEYDTININKKPTKYQKEESCLKIWMHGCWISMLSIIPIFEIVVLSIYWDDTSIPHCPHRAEWTYFILAKLIVTIIAISMIITFKCIYNRINMVILIGIISSIGVILLFLWDLFLSAQLLLYKNGLSRDIINCDPLIDFIFFEMVIVYAIIFVLLCIGCWFCIDNNYIYFIEKPAKLIAGYILNMDITIIYQILMSLGEIIILIIYFNHYGACNQFNIYLLSKLIFTCVIIVIKMIFKYIHSDSNNNKSHIVVRIIYLIGLISWCVVTSIMFWGDEYNSVECRTNSFTYHYFDFMLLDIALGYVIIAKIFCTECWMSLTVFLSQKKIEDSYGSFAQKHQFEWIQYQKVKK